MHYYPILFSIRSIDFYTHGVFAVIGIMASALTAYLIARKYLDCNLLFDNIVYSVLVGIIGARLVYIILYHEQFSNFKEYFYLWQGGLVSYGGFILGGIAFALLLRNQKQPIMPWLDVIASVLPLGLFFGRLGEVISGENFGPPQIGNSGVNMYLTSSFFEAVWCLIVFALLLYTRKHRKVSQEGFLFLLTILLYTLGRFFVDFKRFDTEVFLRLSLGQMVSAILFLISLYLLIKLLRNSKKGSHGTWKRFFRKTKTNPA